MNYTFVKNTILLILLSLVSLPMASAQDNPQRIDYSQNSRYYIIGKIECSELENIHKEYLINSLNIQVGDSIMIPGDKIRDTYRRLWDQKYFSDVKIETEFRGDTVDIFLNLKERRLVSTWEFEGVKSSEIKDLKEKLKLRKYSDLSDFKINTSMNLIREYYNEKAFRFAKIDYRITQDTANADYRVVTFEIVKGKKVRVGNIVFEGNSEISSKRLAKSMKKTKKQTINFIANSKFKDKEFPDDIQKMEEYMHSRGYRDGRVVEDSLYYIDERHIGVWLKIEEGKKYYFRDISWIGNSIHTTDEMQMMIQLKKGDVYDSETLESRLGTPRKFSPMEQSISTLYKDKGYLAFRIEPVETVIGDSVDVQVRIIEGKQFRISDVTMAGNTRTNDHVIRRELSTNPGDLYNQSLLMGSYQRLASMGQFDPASIVPEPIPNLQNETVEIKYTFTEVSKDQFELSGGWGGGMFIGSVGVNFTNVAIRNAFKKGAWRPYPSGDNQQLSLKIQTNGTYYQAFSVSFTEPWLGGHKPNALSVAFYSSRESNAYYPGQKASKYISTVGGSVSLGKRLQFPDPYFTMSAGLSVQVYKLKDWQYFALKNGTSSAIALNLTLSRNSVDDPYYYPTRGSVMTLSLAVTPPYSLMDKKDYSNPDMTDQERYRWNEYHKWNLNAQWFFPLSQDRKLVLMAKAQYGYLGHFNKNKRSPFEGFTVGGDGLTGYSLYGAETVGLRGYENNSLTPNAGYDGMGYASMYSKYIAEMRYPIIRDGSTMVYGLAFVEAGNVAMRIEEFNPFNLKRSAGVGVRLFLPIVGMLGLDWAYGFDRATHGASRGGGRIHFTMGMQL